MNNARSFMILAAILFLFIGACTYTVNVIQSIHNGTQLAYNLNQDQDRKIHATLAVPGDERYTGAEIVNMIRYIEESELNIEVNGVLYTRAGNYNNLNPSGIAITQSYQATYYRDPLGYLIKIVFRS